MKESLQEFWDSASEFEKCGLAVLGCIFGGIMLFVMGLAIGRGVAPLL